MKNILLTCAMATALGVAATASVAANVSDTNYAHRTDGKPLIIHAANGQVIKLMPDAYAGAYGRHHAVSWHARVAHSCRCEPPGQVGDDPRGQWEGYPGWRWDGDPNWRWDGYPRWLWHG
jgi:hypothetical protein